MSATNATRLTYTDHIAHACEFYLRAKAAIGDDTDTIDYVRAKTMVEMSTLALDLAREARLYDAAMFAQEKALEAERRKDRTSNSRKGTPQVVTGESPFGKA